MTDHQDMAERLAAVEAKLNADAAEAAELERALHAPPQPAKGTSRSKEAQYREDQARHERRLLHDAWAREYEAQLERVAPKVAQLEAKQHELGGRRQELERRQAAALAKVDAELEETRREIAKLTVPPPMPADPPSSDAVEMVAIDVAGFGTQLVAKDAPLFTAPR